MERDTFRSGEVIRSKWYIPLHLTRKNELDMDGTGPPTDVFSGGVA